IECKSETKSQTGTNELEEGNTLTNFDLQVDDEKDLLEDLGFSTFLSEATESRALKESYTSASFAEYVDGVVENLEPMPPWVPAPLEEAELEQTSLMATPLKDTVRSEERR